MNPFTYRRAADLPAALDAGAAPGARYIAGGTDLLGLIKDRVERPATLVDVSRIAGMNRIATSPAGFRLGALATMADVAADPKLRTGCPAIAQALLLSASGQLRNMATMGGNVLQRTRCAYFRDPDEGDCGKKRAGAGCAARRGLNRGHAIFGWSDACVATHPSDVAVALRAFDAVVLVHGDRGERQIPFADFHRLPGDDPTRDNLLAPGELIVAIEVPATAEARRSHYIKVRERQSYEFALVSVAAGLAIDGGRIASARIALGGVAHKPWRLDAAERALRGLAVADDAALGAAVAGAFADARPLTHNGFKVELARRAVLRALRTIGGAA